MLAMSNETNGENNQMTPEKARKLTLGMRVRINYTYRLKKGQRIGEVIGLASRGKDNPLVTLRLWDGSVAMYSAHWLEFEEVCGCCGMRLFS